LLNGIINASNHKLEIKKWKILNQKE
jgi:hypothetical protein